MAENHQLPSELYDQISECLRWHDLASFARASRPGYVSGTRSLYRQIVLPKTIKPAALSALCSTLSQCSHLAELVIRLEIDYMPRRLRPYAHSTRMIPHNAEGIVSALEKTVNLQHLSISAAFSMAPTLFKFNSLTLPQLRYLHVFSRELSLTPDLSSFLSRHAETLQHLTMFPLSRMCNADAIPRLNQLETLTTESIQALMSVFIAPNQTNFISTIRRIDFGTRLFDTLFDLNRLCAVACCLEQINFLYSLSLSDSEDSVAFPQPWSAIKRFGMRWCAAEGLTAYTLQILDIVMQAFPALEAVDLFCEHTEASQAHDLIDDIVHHGIFGQLLRLPRLRLVTVLHTAFIRNDNLNESGETFRSDGPLQDRHGAPDIPFHYL